MIDIMRGDESERSEITTYILTVHRLSFEFPELNVLVGTSANESFAIRSHMY